MVYLIQRNTTPSEKYWIYIKSKWKYWYNTTGKYMKPV